MTPSFACSGRTTTPPVSAVGRLLVIGGVLLLAACGPDEPDEAHELRPLIQAVLQDGDPELTFPTGDTVNFHDDVVEFYRDRGYEPAWTDRNGFLPRGEAMVATLQDARAEGLDPSDYHAGLIREVVDLALRRAEADEPVGNVLGSLDILISEGYLHYTTDLRRGRLDPHDAGLDWLIEREDPTDAAFLNSLVESDDFSASLASVRPSVPFYSRLKESLARYRSIQKAGGWDTIPHGETLEEGMTGERVRAVRRRLAAEANEDEAALIRNAARADTFDSDLREAVELFQARHGIDRDGRVGGSTLAEMNVTVEVRIAALELNLDRWRMLPQDLGERYVLVNVAGFEAAVMENDEPVFTTDVVVGQEGWETPLFRDTMEYVVVNPYWNVPESIKRDEILPAVRRDPDYLAKNDFEVTTQGGDLVNAGSVDLASNRYRVRQRPGPQNALGEVKFLFPNDHNIYLHDTPADHLFSRSGRAFSHGCIRVAKPVELAEYLFETSTSRGAEGFHELRGGGEEAWVELEEKLPVYILYFTAWVDRDGTTHFYRDVYGRDRRIEELARGMRNGSESREAPSRATGASDRPAA